MKTVTIEDFLTDAEIRRAKEIYLASSSPARLIREEIIDPNIVRINDALGQENDPLYLAYVVEFYFMNRVGARRE